VAELGRLALWVALVCGAAALIAALLPRTARAAGGLLAVAVAASALATVVLVRALLANDFSLAYVADFSRADVSAPYRLAALWGGMAGSLLWFATLVGLCGLVAGSRAPDSAARPLVRAVTGGLLAVLAGLVLALADPFERLAVPAIGGAGLVPILEHPAMLYHPPLLYLGLATLLGPFALTVAALTRGRLDAGWADAARRWTLVGWTLLAVGMVAGSHWAYVELGWGGYWAWDPVENTALLPWLAATLFLHAARRATLARVAGADDRNSAGLGLAALACLPFVLGLLGALLTRSGATSSVHAFAESRTIGRALGVLVGLIAAGVVGLLARAAARRRAAAGEHSVPSGPRDRSSSDTRGTVPRLLAAQLAVVGSVLAVVLAGTLWPLWQDLTGGDGIAVEGRYFASFAGPLAAAGLVLLVALAVSRARAGGRQRAMLAAGGAGALGALVAIGAAGDPSLAACGFAGLGGAVVATSIRAVSWHTGGGVGSHVAHAGVGLLLLGIAGTTAGESLTASLTPGETIEVAGREVTYRGVEVTDGPTKDSSAVVADVVVDERTLSPSLVAYPERAVVLAETALISWPMADVQVVLRDAQDDRSALLEVGVHPMQVLVWWGGLAIVAGGALSLWTGHPDRRQARTRVPPAPAEPEPVPAQAPAGSSRMTGISRAVFRWYSS
jgi:cytochrome c-type biogenesis protein CcmF